MTARAPRQRRRPLTAVPDSPGRVVLYTRVSALMGREGESFHSPDLQRESMRRLAAQQGLREVEHPDGPIEDIDASGMTFEREGLEKVMAMAQDGQVDVVAVYDLSRLGRNTQESLKYIKDLKALGVNVISTVEKIDDTPEGQYMLTQFLGMAELYARQIGRRWQQINYRRASMGYHHGGPPMGYLRQDKRLIVDPVEGPRVQEAFRRYADGQMIYAIVKWWSAERGKSTLGLTTMKRMLSNPVYIGKVVYNGQQWDGVHEPLIDEEIWNRVQERQERDRYTVARHLHPTNSLASIAICDACERPLQYHNDTDRRFSPDGTPVRTERLRCRTKNEYAACDGIGSPRLADVEAAVLAEVTRYLRELTVDENAQAARIARRARGVVDVKRVERDLKEARQAIAQLAIDHAKRLISTTAYQAAAVELEASEQRLVEQLNQQRRTVTSGPPAHAAKAAATLLELWPDADPDQRNRMLKRIVDKVFVSKATRYRQPLDERVRVVFL